MLQIMLHANTYAAWHTMLLTQLTRRIMEPSGLSMPLAHYMVYETVSLRVSA